MTDAPSTSNEASEQGGTSSWTFLDGERYETYAFPDGTNPAIYNFNGDKIGDWDSNDIWKAVAEDDKKLFFDYGSSFSEATYQNINFNFSEEDKDKVSWSYFTTKEDTKGDEGAGPTTGGKGDPNKTKSGGSSAAPINVFDAGTEFKRHETAGRVGKTLVYPLDHAQGDFDFIKIVPIEYIPQLSSSTIQQNRKKFKFGTNLTRRYMRKKVVGSTVFLPMVPGITESNAVDWGGDNLNAIQMAGAGLAAGAMNSIKQVQNWNDATNAARNLMEGGAKVAEAAWQDPSTKAALLAYFAGKSVGANNFGRRAGVVLNPNLEVLFNGPKLRTFSYNFQFTPREDREAEVIKTIIKLFKKTMAPRRSDSNLFLNVPAVYQIQYLWHGERQHPFLNQIKPCALTQFNVDYTPGGSYMTYGDGSMTQYNVSMNFAEIEPIYNDEVRMEARSMSY